jgi:hypothetical protein
LTSWVTVSFSRGIVFLGVNYHFYGLLNLGRTVMTLSMSNCDNEPRRYPGFRMEMRPLWNKYFLLGQCHVQQHTTKLVYQPT